MSTPQDWQRIRELGEIETRVEPSAGCCLEKQFSGNWVWMASCATEEDAEALCEAANAAPGMAAKLLRLRELLEPKLSNLRGIVPEEHPQGLRVPIEITLTEARELLAILGEGE